MHLGGIDAAQKYLAIAQQIDDFRNKQRGGVLKSVDELKGVVPAEVVAALEQDFYTSNFAVRNVEIVGPQVGGQLRKQALVGDACIRWAECWCTCGSASS